MDRRHHLAEWKRIKSIQEQAADEFSPAVGKFNFAEFHGDAQELEIVGDYDPWGRP